MGGSISDITRDSFEEIKRYLAPVFQQGHPILDSTLNEWAKASISNLQRLTQFVVGDMAAEDSFKIEASTSPSNNFKIKGGDGSLENAARIWNGGLPYLLVATEKEFSSNDTDEVNIFPVCTNVSSDTLTDDSARFPVDVTGCLVGRTLESLDDPGTTYDIIENTATTITIDTGGGDDLTDSFTAGESRYRINLSTYTGRSTPRSVTGSSITNDPDLGDTLLIDTTPGYLDLWADGALKGCIVHIGSYYYRITNNNQGANSITIAPGMLEDVGNGENYTIYDCRFDTVYLDCYLNEVNDVIDPEIKNPPNTGLSDANRLQVVGSIIVDEGDDQNVTNTPTRRIPARYTDSYGNEHYVLIIANLKRVRNAATIATDNIDTLDGNGFGATVGGGGFGNGGDGGTGDDGSGVTHSRPFSDSSFFNLVDTPSAPTGDGRFLFERDFDGIEAVESSSLLRFDRATNKIIISDLKLASGTFNANTILNGITGPGDAESLVTEKGIYDHVVAQMGTLNTVVLDTGWFRLADVSSSICGRKNGVMNRCGDPVGGFGNYNNEDYYNIHLKGVNAGKIITTVPTAGGGTVNNYNFILNGSPQTPGADNFFLISNTDGIYNGTFFNLYSDLDDLLPLIKIEYWLRPLIKDGTEFTEGNWITDFGKGVNSERSRYDSECRYNFINGFWIHKMTPDLIQLGFVHENTRNEVWHLTNNFDWLARSDEVARTHPNLSSIPDYTYAGDLRLKITVDRYTV